MITPKPTPSSSAQTGPGGSGTSPDLDATVTFTVDVPAASTLEAMARKALAARSRTAATTPYVSPSVGSIGIALVAVNGISLAYPPPAPVTTNITCTTPATGCTISIPGVTAAIGTDEYLVTTYVSPGGAATAGNVVISSGLIDVTVTNGGPNSATIGSPSAIAIGGAVNAITISSTQTPNPLVVGAPGSGTILVLALDAAGAVIVGNALFTTPITLTPAGIVLAGPGIQGGGTYVLTGPEPIASPITFTYNGAAYSASVSASTTNANGAPVSQQLTIPVGTATPSPSPPPTPTPAPTKPGSTPSPTPSPSPTPTAPPASSLYVLNAANNTVVEYALGTNGIPTTVRRVIGNGSNIACASSTTPGSDPNGTNYGFSVSGLTVDSASNVYTAASDDLCTNTEAQLYAFGKTATTTTGIGVNALPDSISGTGPNLGLAFDASAGALDFTTSGPLTVVLPSSSASENYAYAQFAYSGTSGGVASALNFVGGWGNSDVACINSPGFESPAIGCNPNNQTVGGTVVNVGQYFQPGANVGVPPDPPAASSLTYPLAVTGTGTVFAVAGDVPALYSSGESTAIVSLLNSQNHPGVTAPSPATAEATWIEGLDTLQYPVNGAAAMTYDPATQRLYVLEDGPAVGGGFWTLIDIPTGSPPPATNARPDFCTDAAGDNDASGNPLCADGDNHYYIVGYDLTAAALATACSQAVCNYPPGAKDLQPVLVIGGDQLHLPPIGDMNGQYPFGFNFIPQGGLTAANGKLYLTNPVGPTCNSACVTAEGSAGLAAADAEIDVYDGTATGYFNDGATGGVFLGAFKDPNIGVPVGVAVGPQGGVVSSARVRGIHYRNRAVHRMTRAMFERRRR